MEIRIILSPSKFVTSFRWRFFTPKLPYPINALGVERLGSNYGGKHFVRPIKDDFWMISGGAGQDISFEIEILNQYKNAKVILLDPSMFAIDHVSSVIQRLGQNKEFDYTNENYQDPRCYELSHIDLKRFFFLKTALWKDDLGVMIFPPIDTRDQSESVVAIHSFYRRSLKGYPVASTTIKKVVNRYLINSQIEILKLDIEGAAFETILNMFSENIFPNQIIVEYDELHYPSLKSKLRAEKLHKKIIISGYSLVNRESTDFVYMKNKTG